SEHQTKLIETVISVIDCSPTFSLAYGLTLRVRPRNSDRSSSCCGTLSLSMIGQSHLIATRVTGKNPGEPKIQCDPRQVGPHANRDEHAVKLGWPDPALIASRTGQTFTRDRQRSLLGSNSLMATSSRSVGSGFEATYSAASITPEPGLTVSRKA